MANGGILGVFKEGAKKTYMVPVKQDMEVDAVTGAPPKPKSEAERFLDQEKQTLQELKNTLTAKGKDGSINKVKERVEAFEKFGGWMCIFYWYAKDEEFKKAWDTYFGGDTKYVVKYSDLKDFNSAHTTIMDTTKEGEIILEERKTKIKVIADIEMDSSKSFYEKSQEYNPFFMVYRSMYDMFWGPQHEAIQQQVIDSAVDFYDDGVLLGLWTSFKEISDLTVSWRSVWYSTFGTSADEEAVLKDPNPINMVSYGQGVDMRNFDLLLLAMFFAIPVGKAVATGGKVGGQVAWAAVKSAANPTEEISARIDTVVEKFGATAEKAGMKGAELASAKRTARLILEEKLLPEVGRVDVDELATFGARPYYYPNAGKGGLVGAVVYSNYGDLKLVEKLISINTGLSSKEIRALIVKNPSKLYDLMVSSAKKLGIPKEDVNLMLDLYSQLRHPALAVGAVAKAGDAVADAEKSAAETTKVTGAVDDAMSPELGRYKSAQELREQKILELKEKINQKAKAQAKKDSNKVNEINKEIQQLGKEIDDLALEMKALKSKIPPFEKIKLAKERALETAEGVSERLRLQKWYEKSSTVIKSREWKELSGDLASYEKRINEIKTVAKEAGRELTAEELESIRVFESAIIQGRMQQASMLGLRAEAEIAGGVGVDLLKICYYVEAAGPEGFNAIYKYFAGKIPGFTEWFPPVWTFYTLNGMGWAITGVEDAKIDAEAQEMLDNTGELQIEVTNVETTGNYMNPVYKVTCNVGFYYETLQGNKKFYTVDKEGKLVEGSSEVTIELEAYEVESEATIKAKAEEKIFKKMALEIEDDSILNKPAEGILISVEKSKAVSEIAYRDNLGENARAVLTGTANDFEKKYFEKFNKNQFPSWINWYVSYLNGGDIKAYEKLTPEAQATLKKVMSFEDLENKYKHYQSNLKAAKEKDDNPEVPKEEAEEPSSSGVGGGGKYKEEPKMGPAPKSLKERKESVKKHEEEVKSLKDTTLEQVTTNERDAGKLLTHLVGEKPDQADPRIYSTFPAFWNKFGGSLKITDKNIKAVARFFIASKEYEDQLNKLSKEETLVLTSLVNNYTEDPAKIGVNIIKPFLESWPIFWERTKTKFGGKIEAGTAPAIAKSFLTFLKNEEANVEVRKKAEESIAKSTGELEGVKASKAQESLATAKKQFADGKYDEALTSATDASTQLVKAEQDAKDEITAAKSKLEKERKKKIIPSEVSLDNADALLGEKDFDGALKEAKKISSKNFEDYTYKAERLRTLFGNKTMGEKATTAEILKHLNLDEMSAEDIGKLAEIMRKIYDNFASFGYVDAHTDDKNKSNAVIAFLDYLACGNRNGTNEEDFIHTIGGNEEYKKYYDKFHVYAK